MERTNLKDIYSKVGEKVMIAGHIDSIRNHGNLAFFDLREQLHKVQVVAHKKCDAFDEALKLTPESAVQFVGEVKMRKDLKEEHKDSRDVELSLESIESAYIADVLPFDISADINIDTNFDYRPLTLRRERERRIFTLQTGLLNSFRNYLVSKNFIEFQSPKLVGADAEGGADVFNVEYFKQKAYLATSPQLYKQIMVPVFDRVFSTGLVYRAEKHATTRHVNEYTSMDVEMGFISSYEDLVDLLDGLVRKFCEDAKENQMETLQYFEQDVPQLPENRIPMIPLKEAHDIMKKEYGHNHEKPDDLTPQEEKMICKYVLEKMGSDFVCISKFPASKRPAYTYKTEDNPLLTESFDLLFRGLEIATCGRRINTKAELEESFRKSNIDPANFDFYMQAFKYGCPAHGGFGMGLERLTALFLGLNNIKEASLFPRDLNRIDKRLS